ncbi:MAG TPA: hypothetical protein VFE86_02555 [Ilumatobacteraceae bacterium]|nr:hypothetical protein [Ilumatobacteraceae bacterium]
MGGRWARVLTLALLATGVAVTSPRVVHAEGSTQCAAGTDTAALNNFITNEVADLVGFDTARVIAMPDGRYVWTVQDAFISATPGSRSGSLRPPTGFAHNALVVQDGNCFTTLHGLVTPGEHCAVADASYLGAEMTATCSHWFWPMSGGVDRSGQLDIFYVEMANEFGSGAAPGAHPVAVWLARFDSATLDLISFGPAPAASSDVVYGTAVDSDASFSYLFGWSYDQFDLPDSSSPPPSQVFVARVARGRFDLPPTYWSGAGWVANRARAVPIATSPNGEANPMLPRLVDAMWMSVVKADDWNGTAVRVDVAAAPQGPWTTWRTVTVPTRTADGRTNTYAAQLMPWRSDTGNLVVSISNNAWNMEPLAFDNPTLYQPRLFELTAPPELTSPKWVPTTDRLGFTPTTPPIRAIDTRDGPRLAQGHVLRVPLAGLVPDDAKAAVIDLAAVDPSANGFLTAWSCDEPMPPTSNLNYLATGTRATHAIVTLAADSSICVFTMVATDVLVDVTGSYSPAAAALRFHPLAPARIYDSRTTGGAWHIGETRAVAVPAGAEAAAMNITVTEPDGPGFVTVFPCQAALPVVSNINYVQGQVVANLVQTGVAGGLVCVHSSNKAHIVIDLQGTYDHGADGLQYQGVAPTRLVDTRTGLGSVFGRVAMDARGTGALPSNAPVATTAVPTDVEALVVSMIAVSPRSSGWAEIGPCVEPAYSTPYKSSTLNFVSGDVVANQAITPTGLATGADICSFTTSPAFHVVDLTGWFI